MKRFLYNLLKYRVLPWLDAIKYDDTGIPITYKFYADTRDLTPDEYFKMLNWLEENVRGKIAMGTQPLWQPLNEVLEAHRTNVGRTFISASCGYSFSKQADFDAFKAQWGLSKL